MQSAGETVEREVTRGGSGAFPVKGEVDRDVLMHDCTGHWATGQWISAYNVMLAPAFQAAFVDNPLKYAVPRDELWRPEEDTHGRSRIYLTATQTANAIPLRQCEDVHAWHHRPGISD